MIYLENPHITDPHINLAIEEFVLRHVVDDEPILLLYVNALSLIVGRNQNVFEEVDFNYTRKQDIAVLRRLSGGGTVYHDPGNLNFSLITPEQDILNDYSAFTRPVINAMRAVGLTAELRNRSSIFVGDKKISGNAQYASAGKLLSHGTLLLDSNLEHLRGAISPQQQLFESRAVQSVRSHVANLCDLLDKAISLDTVKDQIKREFLGSASAAQYKFSEADWQAVQRIAGERYRSWAWNIGRSPKSSTTRRTQTDRGELVVEIVVEKGTIQTIRFVDNDPQFDPLLRELCDCLIGVRYDPNDIAMALHFCDLDTIPPGLDEDHLVALIC